jgi:DNA-directed RNA polymerase alpha subunit
MIKLSDNPQEVLPDLATRVINMLKNENITTIRQLVLMSREELQRIPNIGRWSVADLDGALRVHSDGKLWLGMKVSDHLVDAKLQELEQRIAVLEQKVG